jgi:hypothetical protein
MIKVVFVFFLNDITKSVIREISANAMKILVKGSALNEPDSNKQPKGIWIIIPCKKMKK